MNPDSVRPIRDGVGPEDATPNVQSTRLGESDLVTPPIEKVAGKPESHAGKARSHRGLWIGLCIAVLTLAVAGGLAGVWIARQGGDRDEKTALALTVATSALGQDGAEAEDPGRSGEANHQGFLDPPGDGSEAQGGDERDRALLAGLAEVWVESLDSSLKEADDAYLATFRAAGLDFEDADVVGAIDRLKARSPMVASGLADFLDDWAVTVAARGLNDGPARVRRIVQAARAADSSPDRERLRALVGVSDRTARLNQLRTLAGDDQITAQASAVVLLARGLSGAGDLGAAVALLKTGVIRHPGDFRVNYMLASCLDGLRPTRRDEALRYYNAARALRPELAHHLAHVFEGMGRAVEAGEVFADLAKRRPNDPKHLTEYGQWLLQQGQVKQARPVLDRAVRVARERVARSPKAAVAHFDLGNALQTSGELTGAIAAFREAARLQPDLADVQQSLGMALNEAGDQPGAIAALRKAAQLRPDNALIHFNLGVFLNASGDQAAASVEFREAIRLNPNDVEAHNDLGAVLNASGDWPGAIAAFRESIRLNPTDAMAHINLGAVLTASGDRPGAIAEYREAVRLQPDLPRAHFYLGLALHKSGDQQGAIAAIGEAIRLNPDDAESHRNLAVVLTAAGDQPGAIAEYREAVRLEPDNANAYRNLGLSLDTSGDHPGAIAAFHKAIVLEPNNHEIHHDLGMALKDSGDRSGAIAEYREAIRLKPDYAKAHNNLGVVLHASGDPPGAVEEFRETIRLEPDFVDAHINLGGVLFSSGDRSAALAEFREATRLQPDYVFAHLKLGAVLTILNDWPGATEEFRKAIRLDPNNTMAHYYLGMALEKSGDRPGAIAAYREVIRINPGDLKAYQSLHTVLNASGDQAGAIATYRDMIRLNPDDAMTDFYLGLALDNSGDPSGAIAAYREAVRIKPDYAEPHCNLGLLLRERGEFAEACDELRKGHDLGSKRPDWNYSSNDWLVETERFAALAERLEAFLSGKASPADNAERIDLARVCHATRHYAASVRFLSKAMEADPKLADDRETMPRYRAARSAALASRGQDQNQAGPPLDAAERAKLHDRALGWLRDELAHWSKRLESNDPKARAEVAETLRFWLNDPDLACVRGSETLAALPEPERDDWQGFWNEMDQVLKRSEKAP